MNHLGGARQFLGQTQHRMATFTHQLMTFTGFVAGQVSRLGRLLRMTGNLGHAGRHLVNRRRHLIGFRLLGQRAVMTALQVFDQFRRVPGQALRRIADAPHHRADLRFEHLEGKLDLAELIAATGVNSLAQRVVGNLPGALGQRFQRTQH
ncbi:hypothetical protein D3C84_726080 [compost metagenome]